MHGDNLKLNLDLPYSEILRGNYQSTLPMSRDNLLVPTSRTKQYRKKQS